MIPPQGAVLASVFYEPGGGDFCIPILTRPGFKLIAELEGREERIRVLFGNPARSKFTMAGCLLAALHDTDIYARLTPTRVSKLVDGLKSAMRTADRIADWAAEWHVDKMSKGPTTSVIPEMSRDHFPEDPESIRNIHVPRTEQLLGMEPKDHTLIFLLGELIATVCRGPNFQRSREVSVTNVGPIIELLLRYGTVAPFSTLSHDFGEGPSGELILRKLYRKKFLLTLFTFGAEDDEMPWAGGFHKLRLETMLSIMARGMNVVEEESRDLSALCQIFQWLLEERDRVFMSWLQEETDH